MDTQKLTWIEVREWDLGTLLEFVQHGPLGGHDFDQFIHGFTRGGDLELFERVRVVYDVCARRDCGMASRVLDAVTSGWECHDQFSAREWDLFMESVSQDVMDMYLETVTAVPSLLMVEQVNSQMPWRWGGKILQAYDRRVQDPTLVVYVLDGLRGDKAKSVTKGELVWCLRHGDGRVRREAFSVLGRVEQTARVY